MKLIANGYEHKPTGDGYDRTTRTEAEVGNGA